MAVRSQMSIISETKTRSDTILIIKMEVLEATNKRKSIRNYKNIPISKEKIKQIIDAGIKAPSGKNGQPWKVIVVQDDKCLLAQLANLTVFRGFVRKADCLIIVFMDTSISYNHDKDMQAMGAFIENMLLTATDLGLGACWVGEITNRAKEIKNILQIKNEYELIAFITIGVPEDNELIKDKTYKDPIEKWL